MTKEKIIEKLKEKAEISPNKWGAFCWAFCDDDLEEIANELLALVEQEKKDVVREIYKNFIEDFFEWDEECFVGEFKDYIAKEYGVEL